MTYDFSERVLHGRYRLLRQIGYGGMATVYEATDLQLDKRVAVKVLNPDLAQDELQVARFRQEARSVVRIRHDHLVDVTDQNVTPDKIAYFVMEYLEGQSLGEIIHSVTGPMPWERVVELMLQICEALGSAHELGVIHRDVKPANCFLIQRKGVDFIKVLDLGIAKLLPHARDPSMPPSTHASQGVPGTPEYMAPELARGEPFDHRVDIYSLGIMLYRLLTGELPFYSPQSPFVTLEMQCTRAPMSLHAKAPHADIPATIEQVTLRALAKSPDERWSSALELAEALRRSRDIELFRRNRNNTPDDTTQHYRPALERSRARTLYLASTLLGGLATSGTMFMAMMLIDVHGGGQTVKRSLNPPVGEIVEHKNPKIRIPPSPESKTPQSSKSPKNKQLNPPGETPPVETPPVETPPVVTPSVETPPVGQTAGTTDKAETPPGGNTPHVESKKDKRPVPAPDPAPALAEKRPDRVVRTLLKTKAKTLSTACKLWLDPLDNFRTVKLDLQFNAFSGELTKVGLKPADYGTGLGKCVENAVKKLSFGKSAVGLTILVAEITIKR